MENQMVFKRYELKFLMSRRQQEEFLHTMKPHMAPDRYPHSSIRNLYYDTPDFRLIRDSLDKPFYKEKLRIRSYGRAGSTDPVFVELKKKCDSIVYKRRIVLPQQEAIAWLDGSSPVPDSQIGREIQAAANRWSPIFPQVFLSYERDSYHSNDESGLRLTFDSCIRYRTVAVTLDSDTWGTPLLGSDTILMELKVPESMPLWIARELSRLGVYKTTFSKYGTAYMQMLSGQLKGVMHYA